MRQRPYMLRREAEKRRQDRTGLAIIAASVLGLAGMFYGACKVDQSNGITFDESMCNNGFSGFCGPQYEPADAPTRKFAADVKAALGYYPAREARLIGFCNGRLLAGLEEDGFPAGCDWIEPIRIENPDGGADHSHNGESR